MSKTFLKAEIVFAGKLFIYSLFSSENLILCFAIVLITSFALLFQKHPRNEPTL